MSEVFEPGFHGLPNLVHHYAGRLRLSQRQPSIRQDEPEPDPGEDELLQYASGSFVAALPIGEF